VNEERTPPTALRAAAACGVVGSVLLLVANAAHPRPSTADVGEHQAFLRLAADSNAWLVIHVGIMLGALLMLAALVGLFFSLRDDPRAWLARPALAAALVGGAVGLVQHSIDAAYGKVADDWAAAAAADKASLARIAAALEDVDFTMLSVNIVVFFGLSFVLFGLAVLPGTRYPRALGWVAVAGGIGAAVAGAIQLFTGPSVVTLFVFPVFAALLSLWTLVMSVLLWRRTSQPLTAGAPAAARAQL
jgi:hypothetical protein